MRVLIQTINQKQILRLKEITKIEKENLQALLGKSRINKRMLLKEMLITIQKRLLKRKKSLVNQKLLITIKKLRIRRKIETMNLKMLVRRNKELRKINRKHQRQ